MIDTALTRSLLAMLPTSARVRVQQLRRSEVGYRLARGAFWSTVSEFAIRSSTMAASFIVARSLGREIFGELGVIQSTVGMLGTLAGFGLGMTATKFVAEFRDSDTARAGRVIGVATITSLATGISLAAAMVVLGPWLASSALAAPQLGPRLQVSSLLLLLAAVSGAQRGAMSGFEDFRRMAVIQAWTGFSSFPLLVVGTVLWGLDGAIWGLIGSSAIGAVLTHRALQAEAAHRGVVISYTRLGPEWKVLITYSLPAVTSSLTVTGVYWVCNALLVNSVDGYAQMGLFNAANQWFNVLIVLPAILGSAVLPVLAQSSVSDNSARSRKVLAFAMGLNAAIMVPAALLGSLLSPYIMGGYGREFVDGGITLVIVFVTAALVAVQAPVGHVIVAAGRMWLGSLMNAGWAVVFIGLTWALVDDGARGLALARLLAYVAHGIWTFCFAAYLLNRSAPHVPAASSAQPPSSFASLKRIP